MSLLHKKRLSVALFWWLEWITVTAAASRRPFILFPFVQALQRNNNLKQETSWMEGYVGEPFEEEEEEEEETASLPHMHSLLQVPCALEVPDNRVTPITCIVDTGAQLTVLSKEAAQRVGVLHLLDRRYAGQATGVGSCRVLGRIPAGALLLHLSTTTVPSPAITVLDNNSMGMELLLGLDFMRDTGAILDLREEEMAIQVAGEKVIIPFLRPKKGTGKECDAGWINNDVSRCINNDFSDDEGEDDSNYEELDMSGV
jgi:Aspartyl protease